MIVWKRLLLVFALAGLLGLPAAVSAGGWLVITLDTMPQGTVTVGQELALGFMVRQHGQRPIAGAMPAVTFVHPASGQRVTLPGVDAGATGHYVVRFTPDRPGAWEWSIRAWEMDNPMPALTVVAATDRGQSHLLAPLAAARDSLLTGAAALALVGLLCLGLARRSRGPQPALRVRGAQHG